MLGICGLSLPGEIGVSPVSSNSVTGVSGTGAFAALLRRGRSSGTLFKLSRFECIDDRLAVDRTSDAWFWWKKLTWLGRGVPRSGRTCVHPSLKMSQSSQQACTADPRSSSSGALASLEFCRKLKSISASDQHARRRESVSSANSLLCFMRRWQRVM